MGFKDQGVIGLVMAEVRAGLEEGLMLGKPEI